MAAEIIQIDNQDLTTQIYGDQDTNLISSFDINTTLTSGSYIEYFTYDLNQNLLSTDYNFTQYNVNNDGQSAGSDGALSQININPEQSLIDSGFDQGSYITYYNFLNKQIGSNIEQLYITEISSDRTEIRLDSTVLSDLDIIEKTNTFIQERTDSVYFLDFYLNFGDNQLIIANNIELDSQDPTNSTILIKLYESLPFEFDLNSTLWVVTSIEEPIAYQVNFEDELIIIQDTTPINGPNFNLDIKGQVNNSTSELSYADLITTSLTSSKNQLNSLLEEKEIDINIDYTNFTDFIHFSSVQTRLENFYYKIDLIEQYSSSIAILNTTNSSSIAVGETTTVLESKIDDIITNFDGYDYYLYYSSGSYAWPKTTTAPPYQLATTTSPAVLTWFGSTNEASPYFGGIINSASLFDNGNKDNLLFSIPEFLRDDPNNSQYELFINMIAQHFDNIWIYYKDVTQKYNADNRLESGISKDIVADAIRDFGVKLYQNNFSNDDLYTAFLGLTPEGSLFPFPNITGSLPTPSGYEYIDTLISASNDYIPLDDVNKSIYKRIYHNLPYLLKSKGTLPGLRALITSYGIPDTILRIKEYGGKDKVEKNDWDYWQNEFNYAFYNPGGNYVVTPWELNSLWGSENNIPSTIEFRFKVPSLSNLISSSSITLWNNNSLSTLQLRYTGSGYASGSYSGSIMDPYNQYALLEFIPDFISPNLSCSIYLPFGNEDWWSVMLTRTGSEFLLAAGNKLSGGGDNQTNLEFYSSSSLNYNNTPYDSQGMSYFVPNGDEIYLQEVRYYSIPLNENSFKDYVMNPYSIEGNSLNSGPNELAFRASLGGELYTGSSSIHPKVTGSWATTSSFTSDSNFNFDTTPVFVPNTEYFFYDQPIAGIKNAVSDKIRLEDNVLPSGNTLSAYRRITQNPEISASYTPSTNLLEVAFSPQDEINDDINSQIGYFNIGELIGDPAFRSSQLTSYPNLDALRNSYFEKYTKNYNLFDYIRLIKFFDNSLFKMVKDFVPARTSLASGIVVKQHLLERNRYPQPQMSYNNLDISGTLKPQWNNYEPGTVENFEGGAAGVFNPFNGVETSPYGPNGNGPTNKFGITQSWDEVTPSLLGNVSTLHDSQDEFFNGEFSGSVILVTTQSLNQPYPVDNTSYSYSPILYKSTNFGLPIQSNFATNQVINSSTIPYDGEMLISIRRKRPTNSGNISLIGVDYIKISKTDSDGNDLSIPLGQITNLLIKYSTNSTYANYKINNITEFSTCYLYDVEVNIQYSDTDTEIKNYTVSASRITPTFTLTPGNNSQIQSLTESIDNLNYFNPVNGIFTFSNTPNISIIITASLSLNSSTNNNTGSIVLIKNGDITDEYIGSTELSQTFILTSGTNTVTFTGSFIPLNGDNYYLRLYNGTNPSDTGNITFNSIQLRYTQSISPTASVQDPIILEPYITTPNYYNSDFNPIINNAVDIRKSSIYQDVDYNQGALIPTNFNLLIEGDAQKAEVQDSNYTLARHINPRYNGSRTTSQKLNEWTLGDEGTYGKLPTVESLKNYVAYCDFISGWPPERMNASAASILYLIKDDGTVVIPNTSENSLSINKGTFESGERVSISSQNTSTSGDTNFRNIIRGGTKIEPILYTQIGSQPNSSWSTGSNVISFSNFDPSAVGSYSNVAGKYNRSNTQNINLSDAIAQFPNTTLGTPLSSSTAYIISQSIIDEAIDLYVGVKINFKYIDPSNQGPIDDINIVIRKVNSSGGNSTILFSKYIATDYSNLLTYIYNNTDYTIFTPGLGEENNPQSFTYRINSMSSQQGFFKIPSSILSTGDKIFVEVISGISDVLQSYQVKAGSSFIINQYPTAIPQINIPSPFTPNTLWGYPNKLTHPNIITSSNPGLIEAYGNSLIKQTDISGSGFNAISLPWDIKYGDEFRFEGMETYTFAVKKVFSPEDSSPERIFSTGAIEVHFNKNLPIDASPLVFNLDHFLIRRYVDDASLILLEGFRPIGSEAPFLVKPEYCSPALNKNIDQFILGLTEKGLL